MSLSTVTPPPPGSEAIIIPIGVEVLLVALALAATAVVVARALAGSRGIARAGAVGGLVVATSASAAALRPATAAEPPPERPRSNEASPYVSSNACLGCHPGEHASFSRTYHRTMTQDANARTVLARDTRFERRGEQVWFDGKRVVLTTGSHREQAYWVKGKRAGELSLVPFVWMIREERLLPRAEAFLTPPDQPLGDTHWNSNCIACHAVAGEPRHDQAHDVFDTRVAELGIACEACHGPGAAHVERHRDPVERYMQHARKTPDPTIVNPRRLSPDRSAAICGQCHAYAYPKDEDEWWSHGYARTFRAGDALEPSRTILGPGSFANHVDIAEGSLFWPDGAIRVGGREYNGMVASKCKATCLSCHAMHEGDPAGQIAPDKTGDKACTSCHQSRAADGHSKHRDVACVDCHMPKTSYALLSAVRSHRIGTTELACTLCHLDRPEGIRAALSGDAAMRVIVADALGSPEVIRTTGRSWQTPVLDELRRDPYAAVRFVAERSARNVDSAGRPLDPELVRTLLSARDQSPITIAE